MATSFNRVCSTILLVSASFLFGCSNRDGSAWNSPYSVEYKVVLSGDGRSSLVQTTVKGPAAKLAVILTDPQGKADIQLIGKDQMITNCQTVESRIDMDNTQEGKYVLTVKTIEPEKVVWRKEIVLTLDHLWIKDVKFKFEPEGEQHGPGQSWGRIVGTNLISVNATICQKTGNISAMFSGVSLEIDGVQQPWISLTTSSTNPNQDFVASIHSGTGAFHGIRSFKFNERHIAKGVIRYNGRSLDFEKEFVTPPQQTGTLGQ